MELAVHPVSVGGIMPDKKTCAHPSCQCPATQDSKYCSQYCEDAGSTMELSCNCGHAGCSLESTVGAVPAADMR
jgi:hypothetical protein